MFEYLYTMSLYILNYYLFIYSFSFFTCVCFILFKYKKTIIYLLLPYLVC